MCYIVVVNFAAVSMFSFVVVVLQCGDIMLQKYFLQ